ncbi:MAG TPA: DivIVA domain-containing protein [Acidimicrobiia bacterium]|nr:DivIVA domain-containing protein [Acidimicrobiia bacterium]
MDITPRELRDVEIRESFRGYHRDDVNELLERAAATLEAANERMQQMNERLTTVQSETGHTRETEDILHRTLLLAQRAADEAVGEATAKARQMLDDAEIQSRRLVADAEADARRRGETERRRLEEEVLDLAGRRDALLADVEALTRFEADYRDRMVRALEADLSALRSRPPASPGPRPEPSDVDLPVFSEGFARREPTEAPAVSDPPPAPAPDPFGDASSEPAPSFVAGPTSFASQIPPTFSTQPAPAASGEPERAASEGSTQAVDVQSLFDRAGMGGAALAFEKSAGPPPTPGSVDPFAPKPAASKVLADDPPAVSGAGASPAEGASTANGPAADTVDAEVLDDDAFFATLREAVHDETPLGPREEGDATGENMFFDQEGTNPGFRDVFRRRR